MKRAFTLIELLVVIAIIAILAAILFPVFAQAKVAAKAAASISNQKQNSLAVIMYEGDSDDYVPPAASWNTGSDPVCFAGDTCVSPWTWLILPYMKTGRLFQDPLAVSTPDEGYFGGGLWPDALVMSCYPNYGYNYTGLSPFMPNDNPPVYASQIPISGTSAAQPADTVMLDSKFALGDTIWAGMVGIFVGFSWAPGADNGPTLLTTVEPPECWQIPSYCMVNWGVGSATGWGLNDVTGGLTACNAFRAMGNATTSFLDGHVKKMTMGSLAAGTNFSTTQGYWLTVFTDTSKYLWDTQ